MCELGLDCNPFIKSFAKNSKKVWIVSYVYGSCIVVKSLTFPEIQKAQYDLDHEHAGKMDSGTSEMPNL